MARVGILYYPEEDDGTFLLHAAPFPEHTPTCQVPAQDRMRTFVRNMRELQDRYGSRVPKEVFTETQRFALRPVRRLFDPAKHSGEIGWEA